MAQPTANIPRDYDANVDRVPNDLPVLASTIIYQGAAVGESVSTGYVRLLNDGDTFRGFAARQVDNSSGANGDLDALVYQRGAVVLTMASAITVANLGDTVYATEGNTFDVVDSGGDTPIGKVTRITDATNNRALVFFEANQLQSL